MNGSKTNAAWLVSIVIVVGCDRLMPTIPEPDLERVQQLAVEQRAAQLRERRDEQVRKEPSAGAGIKAYREWDLRETAADALGRIGAPAVPELIASLQNQDAQERQRAARVLARIGPAASDAVPMLTAALGDPDPFVQKAAARALGQIGPDAAAAVPTLMELFNSESRLTDDAGNASSSKIQAATNQQDASDAD